MSITTNTTLLSDTSHLGTPYSGTRANLHTLVCYGRDVRREPSSALFAPLMVLPLVDVVLSFAVDTLILPVDVPLEPERPPLEIGAGGCRLIGM